MNISSIDANSSIMVNSKVTTEIQEQDVVKENVAVSIMFGDWL